MKKGFTIIELMLTLTIIITISSIAFKFIGRYKATLNKLDGNYFSKCILQFIDQSRQYCINNDISGVIVFDEIDKSMSLQCAASIVSSLKLPKNFKTLNVNNILSIDNLGDITSCTIRFIDGNNEEHKITIKVGTWYVQEKQ